MTDADQLERMVESLEVAHRWTPRYQDDQRTGWGEFLVETRTSNVVFVFDSAGRLRSIETPGDAIEVIVGDESVDDPPESLPESTTKALARERIRNALGLILSPVARIELEAALEILA